jgi:hypothetical protein
MPKYYVQCGTKQTVVAANNGKGACRIAIQRFRESEDELESEHFHVNEKGFRNIDTFSIDTLTLTTGDTIYKYSLLKDDFEKLNKK